jgi:hypothetical protein
MPSDLKKEHLPHVNCFTAPLFRLYLQMDASLYSILCVRDIESQVTPKIEEKKLNFIGLIACSLSTSEKKHNFTTAGQ